MSKPVCLHMCQKPLDVSVNKPFKDNVRTQYEEWLHSNNLSLTASGKIKKVSLFKVAQWIFTVWEQVESNVIERSFKKCCITNAMDGSEDNLLWEESDQNSVDSDAEEDASSSGGEQNKDSDEE